ncbi:M20 peptidase aminoacylase family protein [Solibacillus sp. FSL H8-0538]|uniref:M20 peptidase aminoacylase family protein n=1 Tax=Solibacillus sp. FSL H8-0538 TaxID=2921400 RepID=UPI0030FA6C79
MNDRSELQRKMQGIFAHLHNHPEVSWQEHDTTTYIVKLLQEVGLEPQTFDDIPGLYVDIGQGTPVVGLRTDMDALWQEVDGQFQANHSCGHDGHMTMAIGAALLLKEQKDTLPGAVRLLFQPAEEKGEGALALVEKGLVDDLSYLFGVHVRPFIELDDGKYAPALHHGAAKLFKGVIHGKEAHGARPEQGINTIEVGAAIVNGLSSLHMDPNVSSSVKMTQFQAGGESVNIIPGKATFSIDARAQTNEVLTQLEEGIKRVIRSVDLQFGAHIDLTLGANIVAAQPNDQAIRFMAQAIEDVTGKAALAPEIIIPGGEDFHYYTYKRPHIKATMLGLGCGVTPGLHHPNMTFNEERLITGAFILANTVERALQHERSELHEDTRN